MTNSLDELTRHHGVLTNFHDIFGASHVADSDVVVRVLRALGSPLASEADADDAIRHDRLRQLRDVVSPVLVAWDGDLQEIQFRIPALHEHLPLDLEMVLEDGRIDQRRIHPEGLVSGASAVLENELYLTKVYPWSEHLPLGYHTLTVRFGAHTHTSLIIAAPPHAFSGRDDGNGDGAWGVFAPLYSLSTERSWGAGNFSDLRTLAEVVGDLGGGIVGTLPLLPSVIDESNTPSPYAPVSRLFWNEFFIDVTAVPELQRCSTARELINSQAFQDEIASLQSLDQCDYYVGMALRRRVLEMLALTLVDKPGSRREEFHAFIDRHPRLQDYAEFRSATERFREPWQQWPRRASDGELSPGDLDAAAVHYHEYVQWLADSQLASTAASAQRTGPGLYLDFPVGVHPDGYDAWRERTLFAAGMSVGAPPDAFFVRGQDWGFPPLNPRALRESGYDYLIRCIRHHVQHAGVLRIDHVMGLHRQFWVPHGLPATSGVYVQQPAEEMYAIVCLESQRHQALIVGEDLGTVPDEVREMMKTRGIKRTYVAQFDMRADSSAAMGDAIPNSVATINTHDTATFAGFWRGTDIDDRVELGHLSIEDAEIERRERTRLTESVVAFFRDKKELDEHAEPLSVLRAVLRHVCRQRPDLALVNIEDLWLESRPQNIPGTVDERPNWKQRARHTIESFTRMPEVIEILREISQMYGKESEVSRPSLPVSADTRHVAASITHESTLLTDSDIYLFNEGTHVRLYDVLGAHIRTIDGVTGVNFAVWAPDADSVFVMGDFNGWNQSSHPLVTRGSSGIWEGFVPGVSKGQNYKYYIHSRYNGYRVQKTDPFGFHFETPPKTASVVWNLDYEWDDAEWMNDRARRNALDAPISIYEVHIGSWMRVPEDGDRYLTYREMAPKLTDHVLRLGFTHVEFLPVMEHPFYGSWGYQVTGYFAPTSRYGTPQDFMFLIDYLHQHGIGVILDWVPSHFPTDEHGLGYFDGTHLFEHSDRRLGFHPDWKSWIFNYGRNEVCSFLLSSALFWLDKFHADGIRVDGVASMLYRDYSRESGEWIPNEYGGRENLEAISFLRQFNEAVYTHFPDVQTIAEESTDWPMVSRPNYIGGLGFGMKWDMGWMHDTLLYMSHNPIHRQFHHNELTFRMLYAFYENFTLPLSHDEVVHGKCSLLNKMPGDEWQKFANLRLLYGYMYGQTGKKLLFMGCEFGQWNEWYHETSLDWHLTDQDRHAGMIRWVSDLNRAYRELPAMHELDTDTRGFEWIDCGDAQQSVIALLRKSRDDSTQVAIVANFTPVPRESYRIGLPHSGYWHERLNSDAVVYGGGGIGNSGGVHAESIRHHGRPYSATVTIPPLGVIVLTSPGS